MDDSRSFAASARCRYYVSVLASDAVALLQMACHNKSARADLVIGTQDEDKQTAWKAALSEAKKHECGGLADTPCSKLWHGRQGMKAWPARVMRDGRKWGMRAHCTIVNCRDDLVTPHTRRLLGQPTVQQGWQARIVTVVRR